MKRHFYTGIFLAGLLLFSSSSSAGVRYVKVGGTGSGNSWATASSLSAALTAASSGDSLFVASGTYALTTDITLKDGVNLLGGFAGAEASSADRTRIDLDGNGLVEPWEYKNATVLQGNKTKRILTQAAAFTTPTVIDGFTLTNGKDANGGGANLKGGALLKACIISDNEATADGGGVYLAGASMQGCLVKNNVYVGNGGGAYLSASASMHGCKVSDNKNPSSSLQVGDLAEGGIVYSVNANTRKIGIMSLTKSGDVAWSGASTWCTTYNGGSKTDWTLPTSSQLQQVYIVSSQLNSVLSTASGAQALGEGAYWSSTESSTKANIVSFDTGYAGSVEKSNSDNSVRAVRTISY